MAVSHVVLAPLPRVPVLVHHVWMPIMHASPQEGVAALQHSSKGRFSSSREVTQGSDVTGNVFREADLGVRFQGGNRGFLPGY
jgi:hypothetical protein